MPDKADIPVTIPRVKGEGTDAVLVIKANGKPVVKVNTRGLNLRITVQSGKNKFSVPVDKKSWNLRIGTDDE